MGKPEKIANMGSDDDTLLARLHTKKSLDVEILSSPARLGHSLPLIFDIPKHAAPPASHRGPMAAVAAVTAVALMTAVAPMTGLWPL